MQYNQSKREIDDNKQINLKSIGDSYKAGKVGGSAGCMVENVQIGKY